MLVQFLEELADPSLVVLEFRGLVGKGELLFVKFLLLLLLLFLRRTFDKDHRHYKQQQNHAAATSRWSAGAAAATGGGSNPAAARGIGSRHGSIYCWHFSSFAELLFVLRQLFYSIVWGSRLWHPIHPSADVKTKAMSDGCDIPIPQPNGCDMIANSTLRVVCGMSFCVVGLRPLPKKT